jgi:hypothetical protein
LRADERERIDTSTPSRRYHAQDERLDRAVLSPELLELFNQRLEFARAPPILHKVNSATFAADPYTLASAELGDFDSGTSGLTSKFSLLKIPCLAFLPAAASISTASCSRSIEISMWHTGHSGR